MSKVLHSTGPPPESPVVPFTRYFWLLIRQAGFNWTISTLVNLSVAPSRRRVSTSPAIVPLNFQTSPVPEFADSSQALSASGIFRMKNLVPALSTHSLPKSALVRPCLAQDITRESEQPWLAPM